MQENVNALRLRLVYADDKADIGRQFVQKY